MREKFIRVSVLAFMLIAALFIFGKAAQAGSMPPRPYILGVEQAREGILVKGLTGNETEVMIYVDGTLQGAAGINREGTQTDNFFYYIKSDLKAGTYSITAIAKDRTSLVLSDVSLAAQFKADYLPAPIMVSPSQTDIIGSGKPAITGLLKSGSRALVYIDGAYNGKTDFLDNVSGTANFSYKPFLNLKPGWHTAMAKIENALGQISGTSSTISFKVEHPLPAPIVIRTVVNGKSTARQPFIAGVAKNNYKIKIFIDNVLSGEFLVANDQSGTANFAYQPFVPLSIGKHSIYATAVDSRGKESPWSNIINYEIKGEKQGAISRTAANEAETEEGLDQPGAASGKKADEATGQDMQDRKFEEAAAAENEDVENTDDAGAEAKSGDQDINGIRDILEKGAATGTDESGMMNENKEQQDKNKLNFLIFIIFLFAVIGWIFWVNRELIKERREQNKDDKNG